MRSKALLSSVTVVALQFLGGCAEPISPLFKRQQTCAVCPSSIPACPVCQPDETCTSTSPTCEECAKTKCVKLSAALSPGSGSNHNGGSGSGGGSSGSTNIGAIVGGLLGGLIVIGIIGFFVFRNFKKRRDAQIAEAEVNAWNPEKEDGSADFRNARASTHTVGSIASTVLTRASNVIQIAYIPGITNRSNPDSPSYMIPPVPPLPGGPSIYETSGHNSQFFSAEDILRQSVWSNGDNRSSVATTIYRKDAVISPVAATAVRAKAAVVNVKTSPGGSSGASSPGPGDTPPVPQINFARIPSTATQLERSNEEGLRTSVETGPLSPAFSVGETFLNRSIGSKLKQKDNASSLYLSAPSSSYVTTSTTQSSNDESPFSDNNAAIDADILVPPRRPSDTGLDSPSSILTGTSSPHTFQEGDIRMSFRPFSGVSEPGTPVDKRGESPFGDEYRIKE